MPTKIQMELDAQRLSKVQLDVQVSGMKVMVKAGSFQLGGISHTLNEDQAFDVRTLNHSALLLGLLVYEKETQTLRLFVDELVNDGVDEPYMFGSEGPYTPVYTIFMAEVPAGTTDLAGIVVRVKHYDHAPMPVYSGPTPKAPKVPRQPSVPEKPQ